MSVRRWLIGAALAAALGLGVRQLPAPAAEAAKAKKESEDRLRRDVTYLASDECEGRGPTTKGINLAADYIAAEFKKAGLKPGAPDGTYFQPFTIPGAVLEAPAVLTLKGPLDQTFDLKQGVGFNAMGLSKDGKASGPAVFAGFGYTNKDLKYDDFDGLDVKDKVVVVINDTPGGSRPVQPFGGSPMQNVLNKAAAVEKLGAQALLFVHARDTARDGDDLFDFGYAAVSRRAAGIPVFHIKRSVLETMLASAGENLDDVEAGINRDLKPHSLDLKGWTVNLEVKLKRDKVPLKNVIGVLDGAGPLADETVVIGAHYDHLGYGGAGGSLARGLKKMAIHHGADDNGSGSTSVMELARRFGAIPKREGRRLVFMTYSGEELGLIGSRYYCDNPIYPLKDTVAMVNLDMVGRGTPEKGKERSQIHGLDTAKEFTALVDDLATKHNLLLEKVPTRGNRFFAASDHYSFYAKKVPVIFFFTGDHPDYHRPSDTSEKINVPGMREVVDLSEDIVAKLSTDKERPTFVQVATGGGGPQGVRLGVELGRDDKGALVIDAVTPDEPAAKAGLKKGDRLLTAGGKPVADQTALVAILRGLRAGDKLEVEIEREGKKQTVAIEFPYFPRLGFRPDYKEGIEGVQVTEVSEGQPAEKGGIKKGDRIVELGGKPVKDLETYMDLLQGRKRGDTIEVVVVRDGKKMTLKVVLE
jgi:hypothetical protein